MPRMTAAMQLDKTISKMREERQVYVEKVAEIDEVFARLGIQIEGGGRAARRGRPPVVAAEPARKGRRRKRRRFPVSGEQSVLAFIKEHGRPNAAEVNSHWRKEGRGGKADNTLSKLVSQGQLKRIETKGERGSRYSIA